MLSWIRQLGAVAALLVCGSSAWSQASEYNSSPASGQADFSSHYENLVKMADITLANLTHEVEVNTQSHEITTRNTSQPDATLLHEFALNYWNGNDEAVRRAVSAVVQLRPLLTPILNHTGVPDEVAALVLVESPGRPDALSPKGASLRPNCER